MTWMLSSSILVAGAVLIAVAQSRTPELDMAGAAKALLSTLDTSQSAKIRWPFDSEERFNWHFVPRERQGLSLKVHSFPTRRSSDLDRKSVV